MAHAYFCYDCLNIEIQEVVPRIAYFLVHSLSLERRELLSNVASPTSLRLHQGDFAHTALYDLTRQPVRLHCDGLCLFR